MALVLGMLVAASFGSGDFLGGRASASMATSAVLAVSQLCSLAVAALLVVFVGASVGPSDIVYGALAGVANVTGVAILYRGLASNAAGVVAPVTAVVAAMVPVIWGLARGERPSIVVLFGILAAVSSGALIAIEPTRLTKGVRISGGTAQAICAGAALGTSLVLYAETSKRSGLWPVFAARGSACVVVLIVLLVVRTGGVAPTRHASWRRLAMGAGVLDATAAVLLLLAVRHGLIVVVAPIASLAPAFTVVLAWVVLKERLQTQQQVGLLLGLIGLVLVAAG